VTVCHWAPICLWEDVAYYLMLTEIAVWVIEMQLTMSQVKESPMDQAQTRRLPVAVKLYGALVVLASAAAGKNRRFRLGQVGPLSLNGNRILW